MWRVGKGRSLAGSCTDEGLSERGASYDADPRHRPKGPSPPALTADPPTFLSMSVARPLLTKETRTSEPPLPLLSETRRDLCLTDGTLRCAEGFTGKICVVEFFILLFF